MCLALTVFLLLRRGLNNARNELLKRWLATGPEGVVPGPDLADDLRREEYFKSDGMTLNSKV